MSGRISIWVNVKKRSEKSPDYTGVANVDNRDLDVALWFATDKETGEPRLDKNGKKFLSGKISIPMQRSSRKSEDAF